MRQVNVHEAKTHLSRLLAAVERGEEVAIARNGQVVAVLNRPNAAKPKRLKAGWAKGKIRIHDDFNDPLPDELMRHFDGGAIEAAD